MLSSAQMFIKYPKPKYYMTKVKMQRILFCQQSIARLDVQLSDDMVEEMKELSFFPANTLQRTQKQQCFCAVRALLILQRWRCKTCKPMQVNRDKDPTFFSFVLSISILLRLQRKKIKMKLWNEVDTSLWSYRK